MFPCGSTLFINFPNKNVQNITEIDVSLCELFRERMCFMGTQKNRLNETLVVVFCIQTHIFVRFGPSVNLQENNKFYIHFYLQPNSSANTTESSL